MDTQLAITTRRSVRNYTGEKITDAQLESLLRAAMQAPSGVNQQPWHFIVVKKPEMLNKIAEIHPYASFAKHAPLAILVCGDPKLETNIQGLWPQDLSAATQNILLSAHAQGLGACWCGVHYSKERETDMAKLFNLPEDIEPFSLVVIGHPGKEIKAEDRYKKERIHNDTW